MQCQSDGSSVESKCLKGKGSGIGDQEMCLQTPTEENIGQVRLLFNVHQKVNDQFSMAADILFRVMASQLLAFSKLFFALE